ncbi:uncharacterized protein LOC109595019 [Aethina tumida]|uniref:uncharacterized protein LOC109595019 n=1 Tax=Aethina tumida TaxID=116153 RepID=UPI00096AFD20|nr:uncharacterized protein LOC109595019 [Aethina tumida]
MSAKSNLLLKIRNFSSVKRTFTATKVIFNKPPTPARPASADLSIPDVDGLSSACVKVPNHPVGPGAAKDTNYKNPEYFCYDKNSYFEAEIEMAEFRCPQPDNKVPYYQKK